MLEPASRVRRRGNRICRVVLVACASSVSWRGSRRSRCGSRLTFVSRRSHGSRARAWPQTGCCWQAQGFGREALRSGKPFALVKVRGGCCADNLGSSPRQAADGQMGGRRRGPRQLELPIRPTSRRRPFVRAVDPGFGATATPRLDWASEDARPAGPEPGSRD